MKLTMQLFNVKNIKGKEVTRSIEVCFDANEDYGEFVEVTVLEEEGQGSYKIAAASMTQISNFNIEMFAEDMWWDEDDIILAQRYVNALREIWYMR